MSKELRNYLEWRFRVSNHNKYQKYRDEWISNLTELQLQLFEDEMERMIRKNKY